MTAFESCARVVQHMFLSYFSGGTLFSQTTKQQSRTWPRGNWASLMEGFKKALVLWEHWELACWISIDFQLILFSQQLTNQLTQPEPLRPCWRWIPSGPSVGKKLRWFSATLRWSAMLARPILEADGPKALMALMALILWDLLQWWRVVIFGDVRYVRMAAWSSMAALARG